MIEKRDTPIDIAKLDICNCPDYEGGEAQPTNEELEAMAKSPGIAFVYLPVKIGAIFEGCAIVFQKLIMSYPNRFWRFVVPTDVRLFCMK